MNSTRTTTGWMLKLSVIATAAAVLAWLWHCWCVFPYHSWNELRLAPVFLWANGHPVYAIETGGPATTWIYGPLPLLLLWPATWASSAGAALLTAAVLNFVFIGGSLFLVCAKMPAPFPLGVWLRSAIALACVACWPRSAFQYLQADNFAVAFGLLGTLVLLRNARRESSLWLAAACAAAALACKQTAIEAATAQLAWLGISAGWRTAGRHLWKLAGCGGVLGGAAVLAFDFDALWFNLVTLPGQLPWAADFFARADEHARAILTQVVAPAGFVVAARRRIFVRDSTLLLPVLCWLASLVPGLAGIFKVGGSSNSLHGLQYLLPPALLWFCTRPPATRRGWFVPVALACATVVLIGGRFATLPVKVWRPLTAHLDQAAFLARELPGQVWFPWNPLVTVYAERRFDHTEDGLVIRQLAGKHVAPAQLTAHLPPHWHVIAMRTTERDWGLADSLHPFGAQPSVLGLWTVTSWENQSHPRATSENSPP